MGGKHTLVILEEDKIDFCFFLIKSPIFYLLNNRLSPSFLPVYESQANCLPQL